MRRKAIATVTVAQFVLYLVAGDRNQRTGPEHGITCRLIQGPVISLSARIPSAPQHPRAEAGYDGASQS
jgi:hypothetical protein